MDFEEIKTIRRFSVVILGNFNPAILHPEWLDRNQLLPPTEVRDITESKKGEVKGLEGIKCTGARKNGQKKVLIPPHLLVDFGDPS